MDPVALAEAVKAAVAEAVAAALRDVRATEPAMLSRAQAAAFLGVGLRTFEQIPREDGVESAFLPLLERLELPKFRQLVRDRFSYG